MPCTTCGNHEFRYGFRQIAKGHSPIDPDWIVHRDTSRLSERLGPMPYPRDIPEKERAEVLEVCAGAKLARIADHCTFPDLLGYLGLIVHFVHCNDAAYIKTMTLWAWQLRDMVSPDDEIWLTLDRAVRASNRLLSFGDLEGVEFAMRRNGAQT